MGRLLIALSLAIALSAGAVTMAKDATVLTASPDSVAVNGQVTLSWSGVPNGSGLQLRIIGPYFDAIEMVDVQSTNSYQFQPAAEGSYTAEIVQHNKVVASAAFTAS